MTMECTRCGDELWWEYDEQLVGDGREGWRGWWSGAWCDERMHFLHTTKRLTRGQRVVWAIARRFGLARVISHRS